MNDAERERFVRLETEVSKDFGHLQREIKELKDNYGALTKEVHAHQGELKTMGELFLLYRKLDEKIDRDGEKRDAQHKEILGALGKKLDAGAPAKWALNAQKIVQWIMWLVVTLGAFGIGNWVQATLVPH